MQTNIRRRKRSPFSGCPRRWSPVRRKVWKQLVSVRVHASGHDPAAEDRGSRKFLLAFNRWENFLITWTNPPWWHFNRLSIFSSLIGKTKVAGFIQEGKGNLMKAHYKSVTRMSAQCLHTQRHNQFLEIIAPDWLIKSMNCTDYSGEMPVIALGMWMFVSRSVWYRLNYLNNY